MKNNSLEGKQVVVTRAMEQAQELKDLLTENGAQPVDYPCIQIVPPEDTNPLDNVIRTFEKEEYDWLVLTSVNAVQALYHRMQALGVDRECFSKIQTAAIGPATAAKARELLNLKTIVMPEEYLADALPEVIRPVAGVRILLPRSDLARPELGQTLTKMGASVTSVIAYRTLPASGGVNLRPLLLTRQVDAITLTSSSTAQYFCKRLLAEGAVLDDLRSVCVACIGPVTAETAESLGFRVSISAETYTMQGLIEILQVFYRKER